MVKRVVARRGGDQGYEINRRECRLDEREIAIADWPEDFVAKRNDASISAQSAGQYRPWVDVLIVGGGLAGLSLAVALRSTSLSVALVENRAPASPQGWDSRIYAVSPANAAFLADIGVWQHMDATRLTPGSMRWRFMAMPAGASISLAYDQPGQCALDELGGRHLDAARMQAVAQMEVLAIRAVDSAESWIIESSLMARELWETVKRQGNLTLLCPARPQGPDAGAGCRRADTRRRSPAYGAPGGRCRRRRVLDAVGSRHRGALRSLRSARCGRQLRNRVAAPWHGLSVVPLRRRRTGLVAAAGRSHVHGLVGTGIPRARTDGPRRRRHWRRGLPLPVGTRLARCGC
jgi:hypothetical protein